MSIKGSSPNNLRAFFMPPPVPKGSDSLEKIILLFGKISKTCSVIIFPRYETLITISSKP